MIKKLAQCRGCMVYFAPEELTDEFCCEECKESYYREHGEWLEKEQSKSTT